MSYMKMEFVPLGIGELVWVWVFIICNIQVRNKSLSVHIDVESMSAVKHSRPCLVDILDLFFRNHVDLINLFTNTTILCEGVDRGSGATR